MSHGRAIISLVGERQDLDQFRKKNWVGTFEEYLDLIRADPKVTRTAYERLYDMLLSYGVDTYDESREKRFRFRFFDDPDDNGQDAVFGLDAPLQRLVNAFKSAAQGYGIERRVLLLHGPVGSSKSTIARLLKKGIQRYSSRDEGSLFTFGWTPEEEGGEVQWCPMHEEPLHMIPERFRKDVIASLSEGQGPDAYQIKINGEMCPFCRYVYSERLKKYDGDWTRSQGCAR